MVLTFQTSFSADTHSPRRGPRLGFSHLAMEQVGRGFYAEATMWDNSGGSNEELLERAVSVLSTFITSARALVPPNIQMQPTRRVSRVGARLIWRR